MASLRARILSSHLTQVSAILIAFSAVLFLVVRWRLTAEIDARLEDRLRYIERQVSLDDGDEVEFQFHDGEYPPDLFWSVTLATGEVLGRSSAFASFDAALPSLPGAAVAFATVLEDVEGPGGEPLRVARRAVEVGGRPRRFEAEWKEDMGELSVEEKPAKPAERSFAVDLVVARSLASRNQALVTLLGILGVAVPLALLVSLVGGLGLARRIVAPIEALARAADRVGPGSLGERMPVPRTGDEVERLARVIDDMLVRLEDGFDRERRFTSDASHELRSPLTALRGEIEVALRRARSETEYVGVLERALGDVGRLERLVEGLLVLARADAGQLRVARDELDWDRLLARVLDVGAFAAAAVEVSVAARPTRVLGDADLMAVLLRNLIENAVRYGRPPVRVTIEESAVGVAVRVADAGPGMPPQALPHLFDRFYRVDASRGRKGGGAGLGLAIVRSVAEAHGGSVHAGNLPQEGACFTVELPASG